MSDSSPFEMPRRKRPGVAAWLALLGSLILIGGVVSFGVFRMVQKDKGPSSGGGGNNPPPGVRQPTAEEAAALAEAREEARRLDGPWQMEDLDAARRQRPLADEENAAHVIEEVQALLPEPWPPNELPDEFDDPSPKPLPPEIREALRKELAALAAQLESAKRLEKMTNGRFEVIWMPDIGSTPMQHLNAVRRCSTLLRWEAWRQIDDGELEAALTTARAMLNSGRAIGDEPYSLSQLTRISVNWQTIRLVERILAVGAPSEAKLVACQRLLEQEMAHPTHLLICRGERIWAHAWLNGIADGSRRWSKFNLDAGDNPEQRDAEMADLAPAVRAWILRFENQAVEIAKRPIHEQRRLLEQLRDTIKELPPRAHPLVSDPTSLLDPCLRNQTVLRCAVTAIAAERLRQRHGRWPNALGELTPAWLDAVPLDPFDGQPLRLRRLDDGLVIYSVGADGQDDGGNLGNRIPQKGDLGVDIGFRLWNAEGRPFRKMPPADQ